MVVVFEKIVGGRNVFVFLDMFVWFEGISMIRGSDNGYNVVVGGGLFNGYVDYLCLKVYFFWYKVYLIVVGRYQFFLRYWDVYCESLVLKGGFILVNQDLVVLQQIKECCVLVDIQVGCLVDVVQKCFNIWVSLLGVGYGQCEYFFDDLIVYYFVVGGVLL